MIPHAARLLTCSRTAMLLAALVLVGFSFAAEPAPDAEAKFVNALSARNIGPANMSGRIVDVDIVESDPKTVYAATATGGLWRTADAGSSWTPLFDQQPTLNLGDVTVCQSNPNLLWVGTGEANPRNSVSWGGGVYKSTDAGKTWKNMGLKDTHHIGRIVIHPQNPDIVYVAAMGHFWAPNKERGLYKTTDGGKTWQLSKFIDENTGFIDVAMDPIEPNILYAAAYQVRRDGFSGGNPRVQWGPGAGLYKTEDGGATWTKMLNGLPDRSYGRCGLSIYRKNPSIVYAVVQTDRTTTTVRGQAAGAGTSIDTGGIFRSEDRGKTWVKVNDLCPRPFYYGQIRVDPNDDQRVYVLGVQFHVSTDGGKTFTTGARGVHSDHHALWINPADSNHMVLGNDGGLYFSKDQGKAWEAQRGMAIGQFYAIGVDMRKPYRVYGGLQDNGSWGGPTATQSTEGITLADWRRVGGGDGFYCQIDPTDPNTLYVESQYGNLQRVSLKGGQGKGKAIRPRPADKNMPAYRFNWNTPLLISTHNPKTLYYGGNHLFKSENRGDKWEVVSPDLTRGQPGPSTYSGHTITTIAESPLKAGVLYVGTDDGRLHVTRDGGLTWEDLSDKVPGLPPDRWVTRVECSHFGEGTAYLTIDRHRNDDFRPHVFKTTDHGSTWTPLASNLPAEGVVHVIRESSKNKDLLFAGTEFGLYASLDGGRRWHHLTNGLPPAVTVHDLVIHPRERELVIGTHGRSIYVLDIAPLEELNAKVLASDAHLFEVKPATLFAPRQPEQPSSDRSYKAPNPDFGASISYHLKGTPAGPVTLLVSDELGNLVARLTGPKEAGLNRVVWNLRREGENRPQVGPGEYAVTLQVGERQLVRKVRVETVQ